MLHEELFDSHSNYIEDTISPDRITFNHIEPLIEKYSNVENFTMRVLGSSVLGKKINMISFGNGGTKILVWTQMHGDEPTATSAVFDVLNFLAGDDDYNNLRSMLSENLSINFIPLLNPDGAFLHQRENILNIDINRDAVKLISPESNALFDAAQKIKPDFGFNLHDQNSYYTAGKVNKTAAISMLAPPFNYEKKLNAARVKSMKLIAQMFDILSDFIPGHISRYSDDFEPRAFGDNFIKSGISSVLIESGFYKNDNNKSYLRKLNFTSLICAFKSIALKEYELYEEDKYLNIPENETLLFDLLIRNLSLNYGNNNFRIDIGINRKKCFDENSGKFYFESSIEQIGDLSIFYGIEEFDLNGFSVEPAQVFEADNFSELTKLNFADLHSNGVAYIRIKDNLPNMAFSALPFNIIKNGKSFNPKLKTEEPANLVLKKDGDIKFVVVNGFLLDLPDKNNSVLNGVIFD